VVLDACSRRIVGWSMMATALGTRLVLDALNMALLMRRPELRPISCDFLYFADWHEPNGHKQSTPHVCCWYWTNLKLYYNTSFAIALNG
jgi:hypothetical protein